ncbi:hypothetical protein OZY48_01945 [Aliarcobacter cryaerophilus]|uniref:hypothetical protein n=1 Tax=Aliarcobacter cryaerophilus TaxID=28198 RepID=UPI003BAEB933
MQNIKKTQRIKKNVRLTEDEINLISGYASYTKNDFSNSMRELILRGLENVATADDLKNSVNFAISKLERQIESLENKLEEKDKKNSKIDMHILKYAAKNNSLIRTFEGNRRKDYDEYLLFADKVETSAITKLFAKLREKEDDEV